MTVSTRLSAAVVDIAEPCDGGARVTGITHSALTGCYFVLQQFLYLKQKCKSLHQQRKRPAKIAWTTLYRKAHHKVRLHCQPGSQAATGISSQR